jgi:hypothetical protein
MMDDQSGNDGRSVITVSTGILRMLENFSRICGMTPDQIAEEVLTTFCRGVVKVEAESLLAARTTHDLQSPDTSDAA